MRDARMTGWLRHLRTWARSDRIRASPLDGKLLRLRPGACVRVDGVDACVVARHVAASPDRVPVAEVMYICQTATTSFDLRVRPAADGTLDVGLALRGGATRQLAPNDVEVFG